MGTTEEKERADENDETVENDLGLKIKVIFPEQKGPGRISALVKCMRFNPTQYQRMLQLIRDGVWDWVAAETIWVLSETFNRWMRRGRIEIETLLKAGEDEEDEDLIPEVLEVSPYGKFFLEVRQASATARSSKEIHVGAVKPEMWLRNGPGQTRKNDPGWTEETQRIITEDQTEDREDYSRAPADAETLGAAFDVLVEMGYIELTDLGKDMFQPETKVIEGKKADSETIGESNGQE